MNAPIEPKPKRQKKDDRPHYRATFRQPTGDLNPIGARLPTPIEVEVFALSRSMWGARERTTRAAYSFIRSVSAEAAQATIASFFEEQVSPWTEHRALGN